MNDKERQALRIKRLMAFQPASYEVFMKTSESVTRIFEYTGEEEIESYKVACKNCTKVQIKDNTLAVTFTAPDKSSYQTVIDQGVVMDQYNATVNVFFKDDIPFMIVNPETKELTENPDKVPVAISIKANIHLK